MATDIFTRAKAYRKTHPNVAWKDCVKACAGKKTATTKKPAAKKKKATAVNKKPVAKKKTATVGKVRKVRKPAAKKAVAPPAPKKVKVKVKTGKKGVNSLTISGTRTHNNMRISGVATSKIDHEFAHQRSITDARDKHKDMLKNKALSASEKAAIRRDILKYNNAIKASKKHITDLKRSI